MVKITIVGSGYVGLVSGTCLAEIGHEVICCDISKEKIDMLNAGEIPIFEPGLDKLVEKNVSENRLSFTTDINKAIQDSEVIFSAVGTPPDESFKADLKFVREVAKSFAKNLNGYKVFVNKSTVPVGTGDTVREIVENVSGKISGKDFDIVSNPEFLREGNAIDDFLETDRVVIGTQTQKAKDLMCEVYMPLTKSMDKIVLTDIKSSELIKYASNSFLAVKISFINEIANFCNLVGADVREVSKGMGLDTRIGNKFLSAGIGWGGSCFPKDVDALIQSGKENSFDFEIIKSAKTVNSAQKTTQVDILKREFKSFKSKTVTLLGLTFKSDTDDIRETPAIYIIKKLQKLGCKINAYDPEGMPNMKSQHPELKVNYFDNQYDAVKDSDATLIVTDWAEFKEMDLEKYKELANNALIIDGRNIFCPEKLNEMEIRYYGIGFNNKGKAVAPALKDSKILTPVTEPSIN